ncbi:hypothetical protein BJ875DRAFT_164583 [Amylocarpus encephaloides]|uniref:CDP-alcohol phosphatidyltransferase n=1 Tax=Amylocarpus encephaloides TaxID=45428 RepID=A0A9P8C9N0_9HELO|nr:hypothetical protein BJ875DRAFT_164583 [Amylocarpus encephaloides]
MYDNYLRHLKDWIGSPLCRILPSGITANHITLAAFVSGLLAVGTAALSTSSSSHWPLVFWLLNRLLDGADGTLARMRGTATALGGFLDLLGDFIIYSLIPAMLAYGQERRFTDVPFPDSSMGVDWRAVAMLEATFHINNFVLFYISAVAAKSDDELTSVSMRPALIEGLESGLIFTAMFVWPQYLTLLCWGMSVAVIIGIAQRVYVVIPLLRRLDQRLGNQKTS